MKLLTILYIFVLFVLLTPNYLIKTQKIYSYLLHSLCFALFLYFTFDIIEYKQIEGATFKAYDVNGDKYNIEATNVDLGDVQLEQGMSSLNPQSRVIYTDPPSPPTKNILLDVPPLYSRNQLSKDLEKVMEHSHEEKESLTNTYCAANYGENTTCCGQTYSPVPEENQCPKHSPICSGYVAFEKWGQCVSNDNSIPNIEYKSKNKSCENKDESCPSLKNCCPGGTGSNKDIKCGLSDCPVHGKPCVGSWMKENCPNTCNLCDDEHKWDGNIGGKYIVIEKVKNGNDNGNHYVTIRKSKDKNMFTWTNNSGNNYILQRISNTNDYRVVGDEKNDWTIAKVYLDYRDHVKYIIGANNEVYVKQH